jgi:hypothetical protein
MELFSLKYWNGLNRYYCSTTNQSNREENNNDSKLSPRELNQKLRAASQTQVGSPSFRVSLVEKQIFLNAIKEKTLIHQSKYHKFLPKTFSILSAPLFASPILSGLCYFSNVQSNLMTTLYVCFGFSFLYSAHLIYKQTVRRHVMKIFVLPLDPTGKDKNPRLCFEYLNGFGRSKTTILSSKQLGKMKNYREWWELEVEEPLFVEASGPTVQQQNTKRTIYLIDKEGQRLSQLFDQIFLSHLWQKSKPQDDSSSSTTTASSSTGKQEEETPIQKEENNMKSSSN